MSIATKTGDAGTTALMYGRRVSKTDPRVEAYGCVDELNAALGMARAMASESFITGEVLTIQLNLVVLMGELAVAEEDRERHQKSGRPGVTSAMVDRLTVAIDDLEKSRQVSYAHWATPGATPGAAAFDLARTICRRAERRVVALVEGGVRVHGEIIPYLNRLSDLCWLYARFIETKNT